jgi:YVTN family beta-propeller protein
MKLNAKVPKACVRCCLHIAAAFSVCAAQAQLSGDTGAVALPTGQTITPQALPGQVQQFLNPGLAAYPNFVAGEAVRSQLSPDGKTLAIITAGQNSLYTPAGSVDVANSTQYIFLYDVDGPHQGAPVLQQVLKPVNTHVGLAFSPDGNSLYAAGGKDDRVYVYTRGTAGWTQAATVELGHGGKGIGSGYGTFTTGVAPNASGLAVSADGSTLVVANNYNDSISVIDTATRSVRYEHDLRPYAAGNEGTPGAAGGTFPLAVAFKGKRTVYVSSDRDREVVVLELGASSARLVRRIALDGNGQGLTLDVSQARLYVAQDNADQVAVIDTASNTVVQKIDVRAPASLGLPANTTGVAPFAVTLSRDGRTLYAVNAGANTIAVVPLDGPAAYTVTGLIPTAYEPHDLSFSADGRWMYVVNGKSATGPNPGHLSGYTANLSSTPDPGGKAAARDAALASNQYQSQLERASLVSAPVPPASALPTLTAQVALNNRYSIAPLASDAAVMTFLRGKIRHIVYVVKENRTFDQILGDLGNGSRGSPALTQFGASITPNFHALARDFVTLDNFMNPGDGSMDGWSWALQGRVTNIETLTQQINYAAVNRGLSYESEGTNRNVPVNLATTAQREHASGGVYGKTTAALPGGTANVLAGTANHASTDSPLGAQQGYIHSAVLAAGGTVRNYGFLVTNIGNAGTAAEPVSDPHAAGVVQVAPLDPQLKDLTDLYFRGYDQNVPDLWRYNEWRREFDQFVAKGQLPSLSMVRLSHDHMGNFKTAMAGVNTPETQQADNDYAVARMVQAVAESPYAADTLFIILEDDVQDGPDHVDSHRGPAWVVGPYVKQGQVISTPYSQVNVLRTIEDILGTQHINLNTAYQRPMADVFDIRGPGSWRFSAVASTVLKTTSLKLAPEGVEVKFAAGPDRKPRHTAAYWDRVTLGMDFSEADKVPALAFNRVLWTGMKGPQAYPATLRPAQGPKTSASAKRPREDD